MRLFHCSTLHRMPQTAHQPAYCINRCTVFSSCPLPLCRTTRDRLLQLAVYQYHNHWGVVVSGGLVGILTFIHIAVATCAKHTAFLRVAGAFVSPSIPCSHTPHTHAHTHKHIRTHILYKLMCQLDIQSHLGGRGRGDCVRYQSCR